MKLPTSINYHFSQLFRLPANRAYEWCTNFHQSDLELMHERGKRRIEKLTNDTYILTDTFYLKRGTISKKKLVRLHLSQMAWTNTYLAGPKKYSQFLYKIVPVGKNRSRLDFVGLQLEPQVMTRMQAAAFALKVRKEDSRSWRLLARAMEKELLE